MKSKKIWLIGFLCAAIFLVVNVHFATAEFKGIDFVPNVKIPGTNFSGKVVITQDSIGNYIVALYNYGATFAGFVAMFMLVFAGWQWLMAAGRLDKVAQAKNTINGVLIGLTLLFGSYILMSQISSRLVNFASLDVKDIEVIPGMDSACSKNEGVIKAGCGVKKVIKDPKFNTLNCISTTCPDPKDNKCVDSETGLDCPPVLASFDAKDPKCSCVPINCQSFKKDDCDQYGYKVNCDKNTCLDKDFGGGGPATKFTQTCKWKGDKCKAIWDISCDTSSQCDWDGTGNWCCEESFRTDFCRIDNTKPSPPRGPGANKCRP